MPSTSRLFEGSGVQGVFEADPYPALILAPGWPYMVLAVNDRYLETTGRERAALVGHPLLDVLPAAIYGQAGNRAAFAAALEQALHERRATHLDTRSPSPSGTGAERHWRLLATPVLDGSGGVQFLIHHLADRTELAALRETADRLRVLNREQQLLAAFVENSSDFIGISDPEGRPIYVNAAGRRMVGLGPEQPVGETRIPEYYPPELRGFVQDVIVKSMVEQATGEAKPISVIGRAGRPFPSPTSIS